MAILGVQEERHWVIRAAGPHQSFPPGDADGPSIMSIMEPGTKLCNSGHF